MLTDATQGDAGPTEEGNDGVQNVRPRYTAGNTTLIGGAQNALTS